MSGGQEWFAENLRTTKNNDGTPIPNVTTDSDWKSLSTGGYRYGYFGNFLQVGDSGYWWSSTGIDGANAWYGSMNYGFGDVTPGGYGKKCGFSVRCIRD